MTNHDVSLLVVEDEPFNRGLIVRHLNEEGYENVATAEDGREALALVTKQAFDLIFLDVNMPKMDGYAVLEHLKADMRLRNIPVIMISAVEDIYSIVKCIELGAEDYLPKPFNPVLLRARVGASLEKKAMRDREASFLNEIKMAKKRSDELLNVILPSAAASELKSSGHVYPRRYEGVALLFCDIVGFTSFCESHSPEEVVNGLQNLIEKFENISDSHDMEKIKTIGDEFMASAGLLRPCGDPLLSAVRAGFDMIEAARETAPNWEVRIGVHLGPVVAGIVGHDKYQFDVWGNTVNTAARMTGPGRPGTITMTYDSWMQVQDNCEGKSLGGIEIKGKGSVEVIECTGMR